MKIGKYKIGGADILMLSIFTPVFLFFGLGVILSVLFMFTGDMAVVDGIKGLFMCGSLTILSAAGIYVPLDEIFDFDHFWKKEEPEPPDCLGIILPYESPTWADDEIEAYISGASPLSAAGWLDVMLNDGGITRQQYDKYMPSLSDRIQNYDECIKELQNNKEELQKEQLILELAGLG